MLICLFVWIFLFLSGFEGRVINITKDGQYPSHGKIEPNNSEEIVARWPFMAVISYGRRVLCAGTAFNEKWALTVARCVHGNLKEQNLDRFGSMSVRLGADPIGYEKIKKIELKQSGLEDGDYYVPVVDPLVDGLLPVQSVLVYPGYFYKENYQNTRLPFVGVNDLALVKFKKSPTFSRPSLLLVPDFTGNCVAAGWALTTSKVQEDEHHLYELKFLIKSNKQCLPYLEKSAENISQEVKNQHIRNKICAVSSANEFGVEEGDEGGPLICDNRLQGIISHSYRDTDGHYYSFFYDLTQFVSWIRKHIIIESDEFSVSDKASTDHITSVTKKNNLTTVFSFFPFVYATNFPSTTSSLTPATPKTTITTTTATKTTTTAIRTTSRDFTVDIQPALWWLYFPSSSSSTVSFLEPFWNFPLEYIHIPNSTTIRNTTTATLTTNATTTKSIATTTTITSSGKVTSNPWEWWSSKNNTKSTIEFPGVGFIWPLVLTKTTTTKNTSNTTTTTLNTTTTTPTMMNTTTPTLMNTITPTVMNTTTPTMMNTTTPTMMNTTTPTMMNTTTPTMMNTTTLTRVKTTTPTMMNTFTPTNTTSTSTNITYTPINATSMKTNNITSKPTNSTSMKANTTLTPTNTTSVQTNTTSVQTNTTSTPTNTNTSTPTKTTSMKSNTTSTPTNTTSTPTNTTSTKTNNTTSTPRNTTSMKTYNITSMPSNSTSTLTNTTSTKTNNATSMLSNVISTPSNLTSSPSNVTSTPSNVTSTPSKVTSTPANFTSIPNKTNTSTPIMNILNAIGATTLVSRTTKVTVTTNKTMSTTVRFSQTQNVNKNITLAHRQANMTRFTQTVAHEEVTNNISNIEKRYETDRLETSESDASKYNTRLVIIGVIGLILLLVIAVGIYIIITKGYYCVKCM